MARDADLEAGVVVAVWDEGCMEVLERRCWGGTRSWEAEDGGGRRVVGPEAGRGGGGMEEKVGGLRRGGERGGTGDGGIADDADFAEGIFVGGTAWPFWCGRAVDGVVFDG